MEVHLPEPARLNRLPKILKQKAKALGLDLKYSTCQKLIARMVGFDNFNLALRNMSADLSKGWDDEVAPVERKIRHEQYTRVLIEGGVESGKATTLSVSIKISERPSSQTDVTFVSSIYTDDHWVSFDRNDVSLRIIFDEVGNIEVCVKRIRDNEEALKLLGSDTATRIAEFVRDPNCVALVLAFKIAKKHVPFGHVCYRQFVSNGSHVVDIQSYAAEHMSDLIAGDWLRQVGPHAVKTDVSENDYWYQRGVPLAGVPLVIWPEIKDWNEPSWAIDLWHKLIAIRESDDELRDDIVDDEDFERLHARFSDVKFKNFKSAENRLPKVGVKITGPNVAELTQKLGSTDFLVNVHKRAFLRVDPRSGTFEFMQDVGGVLVPLEHEWHPPDSFDHDGTRRKGRMRRMMDALTAEAKLELISYQKSPFYLIGDLMFAVMISETDLRQADWGKGDNKFKRLVTHRELAGVKQWMDARAWSLFFPDRLNAAVWHSTRKITNKTLAPPPFVDSIQASSDEFEEFEESWLEEDELSAFRREKQIAAAFSISDGALLRATYPGKRIIAHPHVMAYETWSGRASAMKKYESQGQFFVAEVIRIDCGDDGYPLPLEIQKITKGATSKGLRDWTGFHGWSGPFRPGNPKRIVVTLRFADAKEPQAVISYWRELSYSFFMGQRKVRYWLEIEGIYVGEGARGKGLGNALALLLCEDAFADTEALARQIRKVKVDFDEVIEPDFNVHADAYSPEEEAVCYHVHGYLNAAVKALLTPEEHGPPINGSGDTYVLDDIG
ncbi:hypothetical protein HFN89_05305 [Rhizobium laguerreae]|nr:hypothetical protein [Rhizobium laguerreae]